MAALSHHYLPLRTGVTVHYVDARPTTSTTPPRATLLLVHGWPDTWFGWRHQLGALAAAGYRCVALDQRGFGETTPVRDDAAWYAHEHAVADALALLDALCVERVVAVGHDWGGAIVWLLALAAPARVAGVVSLCTPFAPPPRTNPVVNDAYARGRFNYQLYFQRAAAQRELEADVRRSVVCLLRGTSAADRANAIAAIDDDNNSALPPPPPPPPTTTTTAAKKNEARRWQPATDNSALSYFPATLARSEMLSPRELDYYVWQFRRSGFANLRWYRNVERNWRFASTLRSARVVCPALMVTAARDVVLPPSACARMPTLIDELDVECVDDAGHFVQQERPATVNRKLLAWLERKFPTTTTTTTAAATTTTATTTTAAQRYDDDAARRARL